jgi:hypothetical protein
MNTKTDITNLVSNTNTVLASGKYPTGWYGHVAGLRLNATLLSDSENYRSRQYSSEFENQMEARFRGVKWQPKQMLKYMTSTVENPDGSVTFTDGSMTMAGMWEWNWSSITLDPDPIVSFVGGFKNLSGMNQDFVFSTSTPIAPALLSTLYGGSTIVTYGDANLNGLGGLSNDTSGNPAFIGTIDGTGTLDMLTSLSLTPSFPGDATQSASETQGLPGPTISGGAANSTIGILHQFNLSAGDQATFNSIFVVTVPEPNTFALLATGLVGLSLHRRRRQA